MKLFLNIIKFVVIILILIIFMFIYWIKYLCKK
ncbi:hypothetical protein HMPREF9724_02409 [Treponema denticola SP37]|uniref:Uncharacterized protein n=1 Tax=Treponema denticola OTK TaxID=999434 RepID=A0A0F6MT34_TREDN|nr:hypothetical protein HMPREF9724_02409 [Treponema denticola SP37]EMB24538.1 hypothetical protein HMPREF9723_00226 [Treponema denticola OTK]EPF32556.1 hypothetical protein HMPREF9734_02645 [Treponema denticola SP44]EPF40044.1 hypothetical protein HMPREF9731_00654 [Treponema denticola SP23]